MYLFYNAMSNVRDAYSESLWLLSSPYGWIGESPLGSAGRRAGYLEPLLEHPRTAVAAAPLDQTGLELTDMCTLLLPQRISLPMSLWGIGGRTQVSGPALRSDWAAPSSVGPR